MATTYNFTVRAQDSLGNVATAPRSITVQDAVGQPPNAYANLTSWFDGHAGAMFLGATANSGVPSATDEIVQRWGSSAPLNRTLFSYGNAKRSMAGNGGGDFYGVMQREPGSQLDAYTTPSGNNPPATLSTLSNFVTASNAIVIAVVRVLDADPHQGSAYTNNAIFADSGGYFGMHFYKLNATTCRFQGQNWGPGEAVVNADAPLGEFVCVTVRHNGGQLRIRINSGAWTSIASGNTASMTGSVSVRRGGNDFQLDVAQLATYNANRSDAEVAEVERFLMARATGAIL